MCFFSYWVLSTGISPGLTLKREQLLLSSELYDYYYLKKVDTIVHDTHASFPLSPSVFFQGLDEEAIVDHGKTSFTTHTNYEKEDLESKFKAAET